MSRDRTKKRRAARRRREYYRAYYRQTARVFHIDPRLFVAAGDFWAYMQTLMVFGSAGMLLTKEDK